MDVQISQLLLIATVAFFASLTQSVTGFGFGIVAMIFLPKLLLFKEANVLSSMLGMCTSLLVLLVMHRLVHWKNLIFTILGSIVTNYVAISFVKNAKNETLTLLLGIALFALSIYFFFFSERIHIRHTWYSGLLAGAISGVMGGLFSIGGPPVVIYFLQSEESADRYMATQSAYFVLSGIVTVSMKALSGFVTVTVLWGLTSGLVGMLAGSLLGKRMRAGVKTQLLRRLVYGVMALSGLINIVDVLL